MQSFLPTLAPIKLCSCCSHSTASTWHLHISPEDWKGPLFPAVTSVLTRTCHVFMIPVPTILTATGVLISAWACTAHCSDPLLLWLRNRCHATKQQGQREILCFYSVVFCSIWLSHLIDLYLPRQLHILIQDNLIHYSTLSTPDFGSEMMNCTMALRCHIKRLEMRGKSLI